jgi:fructose-bisphosphate aldolase, class I
MQLMELTIKNISERGRGILAADESHATIAKRFAAIGVENTEENRRDYREMLFSAPGLGEFISGVILFEETLTQKAKSGMTLADILKKQNIIPGIKVDKGLIDLESSSEEKVTQGLDGLPERLAYFKEQGALFAKWRAIFNISAKQPSAIAIKTNAQLLARYAAICQNQGIVPIVEPEIIFDGNFSMTQCAEVSQRVLQTVFHTLYKHKVILECMILKPSMVAAGKEFSEKSSIDEVARETLKVLLRTVPGAVPTVNFLSGGHSSELSTAYLNAMNVMHPHLPWNLSFSYGRALQDTALKTWGGKAECVESAQKELLKRCQLNSLAAKGQYKEAMERG